MRAAFRTYWRVRHAAAAARLALVAACAILPQFVASRAMPVPDPSDGSARASQPARTLFDSEEAAEAVRTGALPAFVFVSRKPPPAGRDEIPGFGPHGRTLVVGGRLIVRERDGSVRELLKHGAFFDVSHPAVSPEARRVAFAAVRSRRDAWRIWVVNLDGSGLRRVSPEARAGARLPELPRMLLRFDDLQPCWTGADELCFASTRYPQRSEYGDLPVTNLYVLRLSDGALRRVTSERNGAETPFYDGASGDLLFSRWWFNRWRASDTDLSGVTRDAAAALPGDSVNLWQPMRRAAAFGESRLAVGDARSRLRSMGYQPTVLADGSIATVYARNLGLSPRPGPTGIWIYSDRFGAPRRLAGAAVGESPEDPYTAAAGLAAPSACAPAGLPDGRLLFAYDPGARGDFGIWVANPDGEHMARVVDVPDMLELDPAPIVKRNGGRDPAAEGNGLEPPDAPFASALDLEHPRRTFTFHDLDVFGGGDGAGGRGDPPARIAGARLRFYAALARPFAVGGDTVVLVREVRVGESGEVLAAGLPADAPMFEQLVDSAGRVLLSAHGPAHVRGFNIGSPLHETRCIGCHVGHSAIPVPER